MQSNLMKAFFEKAKKEENKALKEMFGSMIKQNFLIEMKERILNNSEYNVIAPSVYDYYNSLPPYRLIIGTDNPSFDICKQITMIHNHNTMLLPDEKRAFLQKDEKYKRKLEKQVLFQIKLRFYGEADFTKNSLSSFTPIIYITNVICNYLVFKFPEHIKRAEKKGVHNYIFKVQLIQKMIKKIQACCRMIDGNLIEEAFNPLRSLVELIMIFFSVSHKKEYSDEYMRFVNYQLEYQDEMKISDELRKKYNKRFEKSDIKVTVIDYMNFGWLDAIIPEFGYINENEKKYKIKDVSLLLDMVYQKGYPNIGSILYKYYRECNIMSHGVNTGINCFAGVMLCQKVLFLMGLMSKALKDDFDIDFVIEEINLLSRANNLSKEIDHVLKCIENAANQTKNASV